jgi:uncharacterized protein (DUF1697 family)
VPAYVAFLRAVNLAGKRKVAMSALRVAVEKAGFTDVATYLQSGNVLAVSRLGSPARVGSAIEDAIRAAFALDVDVAVRSAGQLARISRAHPLAGARVDPKSLHVGFLKAKPSAAAAKGLGGLDFGRDQFILRATELYLSYPDGVGRSKMTNAAFERVLGTPVTVRNWRVTTDLAERAAALS